MNKIFSIFRKMFAKMRKKAEPECGCWNCKHTNLSYDEVPCCWCDDTEEWEPKE